MMMTIIRTSIGLRATWNLPLRCHKERTHCLLVLNGAVVALISFISSFLLISPFHLVLGILFFSYCFSSVVGFFFFFLSHVL